MNRPDSMNMLCSHEFKCQWVSDSLLQVSEWENVREGVRERRCVCMLWNTAHTHTHKHAHTVCRVSRLPPPVILRSMNSVNTYTNTHSWPYPSHTALCWGYRCPTSEQSAPSNKTSNMYEPVWAMRCGPHTAWGCRWPSMEQVSLVCSFGNRWRASWWAWP